MVRSHQNSEHHESDVDIHPPGFQEGYHPPQQRDYLVLSGRGCSVESPSFVQVEPGVDMRESV